ncbi:MAG: metallophosphoesterase [Deltaproteobacteria bacterium]
MKQAFALAHLSDPHLSFPKRVALRELLNKRAYGYLMWCLRRRFEHRSRVLAALLEDLQCARPDHLVITGDLTHLSLPVEFRRAERWLHSLGPPSQVTVIPGNHDAYVATPWDRTLGLCAEYMISDAGQSASKGRIDPGTLFPIVRIRNKIALIGVCTARPSVPFLAVGTIGQGQLKKLEKILAYTGRQSLFRVVLIHHPPVAGTVAWRKRLTDGTAFRSVLARHGAELVLHGHAHSTSFTQVETVVGTVPAIGVPSASSLSRKPWRRARYHIYSLIKNTHGWRLEVFVRGYSLEKERFIEQGKSHFVLRRPMVCHPR